MFDDYKINKSLGKKGLKRISDIKKSPNSLVLKVENEIGRPQAVKVINESNFRNDELCFLKKKNIDGIIKLNDSFKKSPYYYLVFDYYSTDLKIGASRKPTRNTLIRWAEQLLRIFAELEEQKFMHGDIKPENILLDSDLIETSNLKIIDFGLVTSSEHPDINRCTSFYAAPEVINEGKISLKSDVWSYGQVVLFIFKLDTLPIGKNQKENLNRLQAICKDDQELYNFIYQCFLDYNQRPSFIELLGKEFFQTSKIEYNRVFQIIRKKFKKASSILFLLKYCKTFRLREIWVDSIHGPVINCVKLYFRRKFKNLRSNFLNDIPGEILRQIDCKISQYSISDHCFSKIEILRNLIQLYEETKLIDQKDIDLIKVLKSTLKYTKNT